MKKHKLSTLLKYELINTMANFFTPFFGIIVPVIMGIFITASVTNGVPAAQKTEVATSISLVIALIIPFSIMLVSFPAIFSQESEQGVIRRLELFNFKDRDLMNAKIICHYGIITVSLVLYSIVMFLVNDLIVPKFSSAVIYLVCFYLLATLLFVFSYSVAALLKKFGLTYAVTMTVYFAFMGLSGMMGAQPDQLPKFGKMIAFSLPMAYISTDFHTYWGTGFTGYNFMPLIQSFIFMSALVTLVYLLSWSKRRRKIV